MGGALQRDIILGTSFYKMAIDDFAAYKVVFLNAE
jgi:hypothetical protein